MHACSGPTVHTVVCTSMRMHPADYIRHTHTVNQDIRLVFVHLQPTVILQLSTTIMIRHHIVKSFALSVGSVSFMCILVTIIIEMIVMDTCLICRRARAIISDVQWEHVFDFSCQVCPLRWGRGHSQRASNWCGDVNKASHALLVVMQCVIYFQFLNLVTNLKMTLSMSLDNLQLPCLR